MTRIPPKKQKNDKPRRKYKRTRPELKGLPDSEMHSALVVKSLQYPQDSLEHFMDRAVIHFPVRSIMIQTQKQPNRRPPWEIKERIKVALCDFVDNCMFLRMQSTDFASDADALQWVMTNNRIKREELLIYAATEEALDGTPLDARLVLTEEFEKEYAAQLLLEQAQRDQAEDIGDSDN